METARRWARSHHFWLGATYLALMLLIARAYA